MLEKYVILLDHNYPKKKKSLLNNQPNFGVKDLDMARSSLEVISAELSSKQIEDLKKDNSQFISFAPAMPVKLLKPIAKSVPQNNNQLLWNIETVCPERSSYTGKGIICAVLDTGIDKSSEAFKGITLIEKDFTTEGNGDVIGHGTHCAGIFFGRTILGQRIGIADGVEKALIGKVISKENNDISSILNGIDWSVKNGANVISMSLGIDYPGHVEKLTHEYNMPVQLATSRALYDYRNTIKLFETYFSYLDAQTKRGSLQNIVMVAAAGNESRRDLDPNFVINLSPPAVIDGIISVSALKKKGQKLSTAYFSNIGATISAPGVDIASADINGLTVSMSGTSMAAPHVAGCAALWAEKLLEINSFNRQNLYAHLLTSAKKENISDWREVDHGVGLVQTPF